MLNNFLIKYVRDKKGKPFGVVVARGANLVGWSKCNKSDKWDRSVGLEIAFDRAYSSEPLLDILDIPKDMAKDFYDMIIRSRKYYKVV